MPASTMVLARFVPGIFPFAQGEKIHSCSLPEQGIFMFFPWSSLKNSFILGEFRLFREALSIVYFTTVWVVPALFLGSLEPWWRLDFIPSFCLSLCSYAYAYPHVFRMTTNLRYYTILLQSRFGLVKNLQTSPDVSPPTRHQKLSVGDVIVNLTSFS